MKQGLLRQASCKQVAPGLAPGGQGRSPVWAPRAGSRAGGSCGHAACCSQPRAQHAQSGGLRGSGRRPSRPRLLGTRGRARAGPAASDLLGKGLTTEVLCLVGKAGPGLTAVGQEPCHPGPGSGVGLRWSMLSLFRAWSQQVGGQGAMAANDPPPEMSWMSKSPAPPRTSQRTT